MFVKMYYGQDPNVPNETTYSAVFDGRVAPCSGDFNESWGTQAGFAELVDYVNRTAGHGYFRHMSVPDDDPVAVKFMETADLVWEGEV